MHELKSLIESAFEKRSDFNPQNILTDIKLAIRGTINLLDSGNTWATVGSCAQIGKNVYFSGGVGIV